MGKRGQNEGSIYKRKDGRWVGAISLGWKDGKHQRKLIYGKTRKEVQEQVTILLKDLQLGIIPSLDKQTAEQFLTHWLENAVKSKVREKTYKSYEQTVRLHISPFIGKILLSKLTPQHVQQMLNDLRKAERSPRIVAYSRTVLRAALNQALKWEIIPRNSAALVDPPKYRKADITPLSLEESQFLLEFLVKTGNRLAALYSLSLTLGLRLGEATGLRWQDVNFESKTLKITFALQRVGGKLQLVEPKTEKSKRSLPLPEMLVTSLKTHKKQQLTEKLIAGSKWKETGLVFTTTVGTALDSKNVLRSFHATLEKAGLSKYRFHDLRHSCASILLAQNVPARTVMEILGHSQISLTLNTYSHVMPETKQEVANILDKVLIRNLPKEKLSNE